MHRMLSHLGAGALLLGSGGAALAQESRPMIEEIVVTAQKRESSLQDTAVTVSAFDQAALERENIDGAMDVQFSVPNLHFTKTNFAASSLSIRGIGRSVVATSGDSGVGIHFNGAYLQQTSIFEAEFFDVERVEVLRGPQGTLYGRNTTGGVMNIIPAKPDDEFGLSVDGGYGNFDNVKLQGMINMPVTDWFQVRLSGMMRDRDGFTKNEFNGDRIDDRDLWATRLGMRFLTSENSELNLYWQHFEEDDSRMRTSNQTCAKDPRPWPFGLGCLPGEDIESYEILNGNGQLGGILSFFTPGLYPLGTDAFASSIKPDSLRSVYSDFSPVYQMEEDIFQGEFVYDFERYTFTLNGSYQEVEYFTQTDYDWAVPSEQFAVGALDTPSDPTVSGFPYQYVYDTSAYEGETYTLEARIQSQFESSVNFLIGGFYMDHTTDSGTYDVHFNTAAVLTPVEGVEFDGEFAPLAYFRSDTKDYKLETWALFGELYWDMNDRTRFTAGLRYSDEEKSLRDRQSLLNNPLLPYNEGVSNRSFLNGTLAPFATAVGITDPLFHGFGSTGNNPVPPYRSFGDSWSEPTGKLGVEYDADIGGFDSALLFATLARSYKSGGINPPSFTGAFDETFDPEYINSIELGAKTQFGDGRAQLNATFFYYDYEGLQTTKIIDRTSVNENIDAEIYGLEAEMIWVPTDNLRVDAFFSWLKSSIGSSESVNPADPTNGDTDWITLKNTGADVFIAPVSGTWDPSQCGGYLDCGSVYAGPPVDGAGNLLPVQPALVDVPVGIPVQLKGNELPNSPEFSIKLGAEYSFRFGSNLELVPRLDFYWQDSFYYRIYNTEQDKVDSWEVWNASVTLFGNGGQWYVEGFVKNIADEDYITGGYFTDASSANFTNVFILEPRTYGIQAGYRM